jgi:hypothetical protein
MSFFFFLSYKIGKQEGGTGPVLGGWYQWDGGRGGKMVKEGKYGADTV